MEQMQRFMAYAAKFEEVYIRDDWSLLEPFFTEDAVYEVVGPSLLSGRHKGRDAVFAGLKDALDRFDRRFDQRKVSVLGTPEPRGDGLWFRWQAAYHKDGLPELTIEGEETAQYRDGRIARLEDRYSEEQAAHLNEWWAKHGAALN